jgi:CRISPR/Cas system CSM-associated protein Csm5 (group 7 of RAMP superfamily)
MIRPGCSRLSDEVVSDIFHSLETTNTISKRYGISEAQVDRIKRANGEPITVYGDTLTAGGR